VYYDVQAESSGWLLKSPLAGGWVGRGHIVSAAVQAAQLFTYLCLFLPTHSAEASVLGEPVPGTRPDLTWKDCGSGGVVSCIATPPDPQSFQVRSVRVPGTSGCGKVGQ